MKTFLAFLLLALGASGAHADTLLLISPSPHDVIGVQCGAGTTRSVATGFSGYYLTGYTEVSTRCALGTGRLRRTKTYSGCGISTWDLAGRLTGVAPTLCDGADPALVFSNDAGYSAGTVGTQAYLNRPDVLPVYAWTAQPSLSAPAQERTEVIETLTNVSAVPLHVYGADVVGRVGVYLRGVAVDAANCAEADLLPGASCAVAVVLFPAEEEAGATLVLTLSARTTAASEVEYQHAVAITEPIDEPDPPPPPPPVPGVTVVLGASACDASYVCPLVPADTSVITGGAWSLVDWSLSFGYPDGTTATATLIAIVSAAPESETTYLIIGTNAVFAADGSIMQTIDWTLRLAVDGTALSIVNGVLTFAPVSATAAARANVAVDPHVLMMRGQPKVHQVAKDRPKRSPKEHRHDRKEKD